MAVIVGLLFALPSCHDGGADGFNRMLAYLGITVDQLNGTTAQ